MKRQLRQRPQSGGFRGTQKRAISHIVAAIFLLILNEKRLFLLQQVKIIKCNMISDLQV